MLPWPLPSLSLSFISNLFTLFIGFSTIFSLYLLLKYVSSLPFFIVYLSQKHKYTHTHVHTHTPTHTRVPHTSSMFRCCFTGLSLCLTYIFIIPQYYHMPGKATILLSASHFDSHHTKIEQKKASQTDNMNALFKVLGFYNYISCFPKKSPCIGTMASHLAPSAGRKES